MHHREIFTNHVSHKKEVHRQFYFLDPKSVLKRDTCVCQFNLRNVSENVPNIISPKVIVIGQKQSGELYRRLGELASCELSRVKQA